jgi:hypothetical protein
MAVLLHCFILHLGSLRRAKLGCWADPRNFMQRDSGAAVSAGIAWNLLGALVQRPLDLYRAPSSQTLWECFQSMRENPWFHF